MEGGKEQNYWPGFVDALSNVVLTLVFVLIVFVFALVMSADKTEKKMKEMAEQKTEEAKKTGEVQKVNAEMAKLQAQLDDALAEVKTLKGNGAQSQSDASTEKGQDSIAKYKKSDISQQANTDEISKDMIITFSQNAIALTDDTSKKLTEFLEKNKSLDANHPTKITIESSNDPTAPNAAVAQEAELGRNLNVRNIVLKEKVNATDITVKNVQPNVLAGTYNWVKIHVGN